MSPGRKALVIILFIVLLAVVFGGGEKSTQPDKIATPLQQVSAAEPTATVKDKETARASYAPYRYRTVITHPQDRTTATITSTPIPTRRPTLPPTPTPTPTLRIVRVLDDSEIYVWIAKTGKKYHSDSDCSNMSNPLKVTLETAKAKGYDPCKKCKPPK